MGRTKSNIIELFIDKAVLAVAAIIALAILLIFVIGSPNQSPGKINEEIRQNAEELDRKLKEKIPEGNSYAPQTSLFLAQMRDSIKIGSLKINFPLPSGSEHPGIESDRTYQIPKIGQIDKPSIAVVTMAAFVPTEELTEEVPYDKAETKLQDIDLVTVASNIDAKQLYEDFHNAFAGKNIPPELKEEQYGRPVFAKVELQRRALQKDGTWGQWAEIPRIIINQKKALELSGQADDYTTQIVLEQFAKIDIRNQVLQPRPYDNAISGGKWICPPFYNERQKRFEKEKEDAKKQQIEAEKAKRLQERANPNKPRTAGQKQTPIVPTPIKPKPNAPVPETTIETKTAKTSTEEQQFDDIILTDKTNPANLEKLVFWAHDDTAVPGEKYQYRIRVGVLNPIAGKPWFNNDQKDLQNQIILFSSFSESDPTKPIEIPRHLYFFATDSKEKDKSVEIKVARHTMGNWITKIFNTKAGDQIGSVIEPTGTKIEKANIPLDSIDLSTGNVMVDTRRITGCTAAGKVGEFDELLYCKPGQDIETTPIKERFWSEENIKIYKDIEEADAGDPVFLLTRSEVASGVTTAKPSLPKTGTEPLTPPITKPQTPVKQPVKPQTPVKTPPKPAAPAKPTAPTGRH